MIIQNIREWATSWVAYIFILLICLSFGLWGIHSYFGSNANGNAVAKINGTEISTQVYNRAYERARQSVLQQYSQSTPLSAAQRQMLKAQVMQELVRTQLLFQSASKMNYFVPVASITATIENMDQFKKNGVFSPELYQRFISSGWYNRDEFIEAIRTQQLIQQVQAGYFATAFSTDYENEWYAKLNNQTRNVSYVTVPLSTAKTSVTDDALQSFYQNNQNRYIEPEKISLNYVKISATDVANNIHPSKEQLKTYFEENKEKYNDQFDSNQEKIKKDYVAEQASQQLIEAIDKMTNVSFEQPASLDATAKALNLPLQETEFFGRDGGESDLTKNPLIIEAAFSDDVLNNNNNSQVIALDANTHIVIHLKSRKPESVKPFEAVKDSIKSQLIQANAVTQSKEIAESLLKSVQAGNSLQDVAKQNHLKIEQKNDMARGDKNIDSLIMNAAFAIDYHPQDAKENAKIVLLNAGSSAVVLVTKVKFGDKPQAGDAEKLAISLAQIEYALYVNSLMANAKVEYFQ